MTLTKEYIDNLDKETIETEYDIYLSLVHIVDDGNRMTTINRVRAKAVKFGCARVFDRLLKAAEKDKAEEKSNNHFEASNNKVYQTGNWEMDDKDGVIGYTSKGILKACTHPIYIDRFYKNYQTQNRSVRLVYKETPDAPWETYIVEKNIIAAQKSIVDKLSLKGIEVTCENARALISYLSDFQALNKTNIEMIDTTLKLGWINDSFVPYDKDYQVECAEGAENFKKIADSIGEKGSYMEWLKLVANIRKTKRFEPRICMAAAAASLLVKETNSNNFVVNLWGESGKGKTVTTKLVISMFADPNGPYLSSSRSTSNAHEARADFFNNFPVVIDDLTQMLEQNKGNHSALIYQLCEGNKDRSNIKQTLQDKKEWNSAILTNSEKSVIDNSMTGGAINRIVDVRLDKGYVYKDGHAVIEVIRNNYGFFGSRFVSVLKDMGWDKINEMKNKIEDQFKNKSKEQNDDKEQKQYQAMALIVLADQLIEKHFFKDGILLERDKCYEMVKSQEEIDEYLKLYKYVLSMYFMYRSKYFIVRNPRGGDDEGLLDPTAYHGEVWGVAYEDKNYVAIHEPIFNKWCEQKEIDPSSFRQWARDKGVLEHNKGLKQNVTVDNHTWVCVAVKFDDDWDGFIDVDKIDKNEPGMQLPYRDD